MKASHRFNENKGSRLRKRSFGQPKGFSEFGMQWIHKMMKSKIK